MGTFSNTVYTSTIESLVQASTSKLNNPYYAFSDKKPTKVIYWKQNKPKTTLDPGSLLNYAHVSPQSAIKFNKINNFVLYGIGNMPVDYDVGDNGLEASAISGEAVVLPNTIEPLPGDFFSIPYIKEDLLFKVNAVTPDTLDTGANIYKIEYQLELTNSSTEIDKQVVETYEFIIEYVGTEFNCFLSSVEVGLVQGLEEICETLQDTFTAYFYNTRVQTYVYSYNNSSINVYNGALFYDPCMIEFIRRNKLLGSDVYVAHQTHVSHTFPLEYSKSIFYAIEEKDLNKLFNAVSVTVNQITEINTLFYPRIETYYQIKYGDKQPMKTRLNIFNGDIISHMNDNTKYLDDDKNRAFNILMSYFNGEENYINESIIDIINSMDESNNKELFYLIPTYLYIIRSYINTNILSTQFNPSTIQ